MGVRGNHCGAAGSESPAEIRQAKRELCDLAGAQAIYSSVAGASRKPAVCRVAEGAGFFFAGLGPQFAPDGDACVCNS